MQPWEEPASTSQPVSQFIDRAMGYKIFSRNEPLKTDASDPQIFKYNVIFVCFTTRLDEYLIRRQVDCGIFLLKYLNTCVQRPRKHENLKSR